MAAAHRCPACGFESDNFPDRACPQCGNKLPRPVSVLPWLAALVHVFLLTAFMFAFHLPRPIIAFFALVSFFAAVLSFRLRRRALASPKPLPRPVSSQPTSVIRLNLIIAALSLAFLACLLFGFVIFINAYNAVQRVQGQPYHATTFQVIRPYYQKSAGMHGPDISVYTSGMVEGNKEWMNLRPYLKRNPSNQAELDSLVPPGTTIPVYLFPNLKGRSRIQVIDALPPGEAGRRTEMLVLRRVPVVVAVLGALIFLLIRIRRSYASSAAQTIAASA